MDTPEIFVSHHRRPPRYPPYSASPMAIPSAHDAVPPPLPPPRHIPDLGAGQDPGWQWGNDPSGADFGRAASVKPGSSLLGGFGQNFKQGKEHDERTHNDFDVRRGSSISTVTPVARDADMAEDNFLHNDEDSASRPSSNYRYVLCSSQALRQGVVRCTCHCLCGRRFEASKLVSVTSKTFRSNMTCFSRAPHCFSLPLMCTAPSALHWSAAPASVLDWLID